MIDRAFYKALIFYIILDSDIIKVKKGICNGSFGHKINREI